MLLRRQAQQLLLHDTDKNTTGKPLMKWLHLDGTVISSSFPFFFFGLEYFSKPVDFRSTNQETALTNHKGNHLSQSKHRADIYRQRKAEESYYLHWLIL